MSAINASIKLLVGLLIFVVWLAIVMPITNDVLNPFLTENNVPYSEIISVLVSLMPLICITLIVVLPILEVLPA